MHSLLLSLFVTNYCYFEEQPEFYLRTFFYSSKICSSNSIMKYKASKLFLFHL